MSTSPVSGPIIHDPVQNYFQTRLADVQQLGKALQSGDLAGAQQAYDALAAIGQNGPFTNGNSFHVARRQHDLNAIGKALQSGDLAGAQAAFAALSATASRRATPDSGPGTSNNAGPEIVINLNSTGGSAPASSAGSSSSSPSSTAAQPEVVLNLNANASEEIQINLGGNGSSGSGSHVNIEVNGGSSGNAANQISISLNGNSEQIILNLLNSSSASTPTASIAPLNVVA